MIPFSNTSFAQLPPPSPSPTPPQKNNNKDLTHKPHEMIRLEL